MRLDLPRWGVFTVTAGRTQESLEAEHPLRHVERNLVSAAVVLKHDLVDPEQTQPIPPLPRCSSFRSAALRLPPCFCSSSSLGILEEKE